MGLIGLLPSRPQSTFFNYIKSVLNTIHRFNCLASERSILLKEVARHLIIEVEIKTKVSSKLPGDFHLPISRFTNFIIQKDAQ